MSTLTQTRPPTEETSAPAGGTAYLPVLEDVRPISFARLVRVELRKLVDTRSGKGVLIGIVGLTAVAMGIVLWLLRDEGAEMIALIGAAAGPQAVLLPVLGIMTAANEWGQRTALMTFTQEPRRLRVMAAKTVAALLLGLGVLVVTLALAVGGHVLSATLADAPVDASMTLAEVTNLTVVQVQGVLMGVGLGALLLNVPLGIVAYFLIPVVSNLAFTSISWLREHAAWLDMGTAGQPLMGDQWLTSTQWAQFGTTTALWVLLPLAVGLWRVATKEVK